MPHVDISMFAGRTEEQKKAAAEAVIQALMDTLGCERSHLSVSIHDYDPEDWNEKLHAKVDPKSLVAGEVWRIKK